MKLVSWNVNGVRAALKKGLLGYVEASGADVICLQETKAQPGDVQHVAWPGYEPLWNSAEKKGYSGTAMLVRVKPKNVALGIGMVAHDREGRVLAAEFPDFWLVNVYQPNSQRGLARLAYRTVEWDPAFLAFLRKLEKKGKPVLFCGDLNVAHTEIDLANPRSNRRNAGFTDEERTNFTTLLERGFVDTFREFEKGPGRYSWWSQMGDCRARNIGWRVDYFVASEKLRPALKRAWISPEVMGSDHCPVGLELFMNELKELMLRSPKLTLAVAESMTSGRVQARVGAISGASYFFLGGITAYNLDEKVRHLGIDPAEAKSADCVSAGIAEQMARGACALFGSDLGMATTGYAEPSADPVVADPFAWWAVAWRKSGGGFTARHGRVDCPGAARTEAQERVADAALAALVAWLKTERG